MSDDYVKFELAAAIGESEEFADVLVKLQKVPHGVFVTTGAVLSGFVKEEQEERPMLIMRSQRVSTHWLTEDAFGPTFAIDGCENEAGGSPYLIWSGCELSVAVATFDISDALYAGKESGKVLVAWVTDDALLLTSFDVDEEFLDYWHGVSKALEAWRFVPSDEYIDSVHAGFPFLISDYEKRFIGQDGEPTYVAQLME
jgi:hypothetical protein